MKGIYNENFKTVRKEIEVDTERLHSLMNGQNTVTMAMFTQAIYRFNTISAIPTRLFMYIGKTTLKRPQIFKAVLSKESKAGRPTMPYLK